MLNQIDTNNHILVSTQLERISASVFSSKNGTLEYGRFDKEFNDYYSITYYATLKKRSIVLVEAFTHHIFVPVAKLFIGLSFIHLTQSVAKC